MPGVISNNPPQKINNPSKRESAGIFPILNSLFILLNILIPWTLSNIAPSKPVSITSSRVFLKPQIWPIFISIANSIKGIPVNKNISKPNIKKSILFYLKTAATDITLIDRHLIMWLDKAGIRATAFRTQNRRIPFRHNLLPKQLLIGFYPIVIPLSRSVHLKIFLSLSTHPTFSLSFISHFKTSLCNSNST